MKLFVNSVKHIDFHWHKEVEVVYVLHGSIIMYLDQQQYTLQKDDVIVVNSMSVHKIERTNQDNVLLTLQFGPELMNNNTFITCNSALNVEQDAPRLHSIKQYLAQMVWEINKKHRVIKISQWADYRCYAATCRGIFPLEPMPYWKKAAGIMTIRD